MTPRVAHQSPDGIMISLRNELLFAVNVLCMGKRRSISIVQESLGLAVSLSLHLDVNIPRPCHVRD